MSKTRGTRTAVLAAAAIAAIATHAGAAALTWNDATPPGNWSDAANWTGGAGAPVAADTVTFNNTGASNTQGSITNTVDTNFTVAGALYEAQSDLLGDNKFHTMEIPTGVTLTLNGNPATGILHVGSRTNAATAYAVHTTVTGAGTLTLNNASATADIRQGSSAGSFTGRATLDMSNLASFNATVANFRIGNGDGSSTTFNRAAGTVLLATNSTITAGTVITGFVSASSGAASQLTLNTNTTINANTFQFGIRKGNGSANRTAVTNGSLIVRNQAGTGRANLEIAQAQASEVTATNANGTLDFTSDGGVNRGGGSVNMLLGNLLIARGNANVGSATQGRGTGRLTYDAGIIDANDVIVGEAGNVAGKGNSIGTLEVKGTGQLIVNNNLTLGRNTVGATTTGIPTGTLTIGNTGATASAKISGALIDGGGLTSVNLTDASLNAGSIGSVASPIDTLAINNGKLTVNLNTGAASGNITTLTADGTNKFGVNVTGTVAAGVYPVIDYGTLGGTGGFGSFSLDKLPARMVATLQDSGSTLDLNVSSYDSPKWTGSINSNWNVNTTQNWQLIVGGTPTTYQEDLATYITADNVRFDDSASTGNVNVATTVAPGSIVVDNTAAGVTYNFTGSGAIVGGAPLTKSGDGSVTFANTGVNAVGPITINAGTVRIGDNAAAGGGLGSYGSASVASGATLAFAPASGDALTYSGVISGAGAVTHTGAGRTTLSGSNTYTGSTDISAGTVVVTNNNSFGPITTGATAVNVTGTGQIDIAGVTGLNALDFAQFKVFNIAGSGPDGNGAIVNSGAVGQQNAIEKINLTGNATIGATSRWDVRGTDAIRGNLNLNGNTLTKTGAGQFSIVRSDVTDGNIDVQAGTLRVETTTAITGSGLISMGPGSILSLQNVTGAISRPIALNGATITDSNQTAVSTIQSPVTVSGASTYDIQASTGFTFTGAISGAGSITKTGNGKLVMANASNIFTGGLTANVGTLELAQNNSNHAINTGPLAIAAGARVDIKDNKLITTSPAGTQAAGIYSGVQGLVQQASNGGAWDQPGLTTSMPDAAGGLTSIGVATGEQILGLGPTDTAIFAGQTITGASTVAMYTYAGDANMDGLISGDDYAAIDLNVAIPGSDGWYNGDFNYDGIISGDDYAAIDLNIALQGAPFPTGGSAGLSGVTAVPEPASIAMLGLSALAAGRRRRRSV